MAKLSDNEIREKLVALPGWKYEAGALAREYEFPDFVAAMRFVNAVAEQAESAGHHPDIDVRYNKVRLALSSHDEGGLTERDMKMAETLKPLGQGRAE